MGGQGIEGLQQSRWAGRACPYCGSANVVTGLNMNQNIEVGPFGLVYAAAGIFRGTELLYADLCRSCGTVTRLYVKNTNRNWSQKGGGKEP